MWLRLYTDILNDPKVQRLSGEDFKGWINILALAKEHGGLIPPLEDVAFRLRTTEEDAQRLVEVLVKRGLLDTDGANTGPHNWHKRQFESDNSTERVKRFRNASETLVETIPETDTESETDSEPEQIQSRAETEASRGKPRSARTPVLPDEEYLDSLQANPAYSMLNVRLCYQRMLTWCENNYKQPSRRRFINWLNREDKPMTAKASPPKNTAAYVGKSPAPPLVDRIDKSTEFNIEADAYMSDLVEELIAREDFTQLGYEYNNILREGGAKKEWQIRLVAYYELHKNEPATPEQMAALNASINTLANR